MSAAYDIAKYLSDQAGSPYGTLGSTIGVNAFMDKGDNEVAIYEFPGLPDTKAHGGVVSFEHPNIQIQVRNVSANTASTRSYQIYMFLRGKMDQTLNGHTYQYIESLSSPRLLTRDEKNRTIFIAELTAHRSPES